MSGVLYGKRANDNMHRSVSCIARAIEINQYTRMSTPHKHTLYCLVSCIVNALVLLYHEFFASKLSD